jgi:hypothetical protein
MSVGDLRRKGSGELSTMTSPPAVGPGVLRPCRLDDDGPRTLDPAVARLHHRLRVEVAARLLDSVPDGWEVSAGCCWQPSTTSGTLHPDVVVHRTLGRGRRLLVAPVLCVDIGAGPAGPRTGRTYAQLGVDHHWHVDSTHGTLQVSVRVDDVYRRCESFSAEALAPGQPSHGLAWVDFGVGIAQLDGLLPAPPTPPRPAS